jgi:diguanylate cyclase (GGDEF)-like protein/PAS domain S-box-containing protein
MSASTNELLKLLLLARADDTVDLLLGEDAELAARLHMQHVHDTEALEHLIASERWDVVLARATLNGTNLSGAISTVQNANPDVPVIAFEDTPTREQVVQALRAGACDLVGLEAGDHLRLVIERELANVNERRARRLLDVQHREFQRQTFALLKYLNDPIFIVRAGQVLHANPAAIRLCGCKELDDVRGQEFVELVAVRDRSRTQSFLRNLTGGNKVQRIEIAMMSREGLPFDVTVSFSRTFFGGSRSHLAMVRTSPGRADAQQAMYAMSRWDQLTGLHTQRHFLAGLADSVAAVRRHRGTGALLLIELENFRAMRQTVGIVASDLLVKDLASMVAREARDASAIGRFGNHTFAVLLQDTDLEQAVVQAEQLRAGVEQHTSEVAEQSLATTCSVAVVPLSRTTSDAESLMREAERLCQQAVERGGNRVMRPEPDTALDQGSTPQIAGLAEIVSERRLRVLWQPIVHLHGGQEESYEVSVAAHDGEGRLIASEELDAAAGDDVRAELDRWLLEQSIGTAHKSQVEGHEVHFFIRLSSAAVSDESTLVLLSRLLRTHAVDRHRLTFQIPEHAAARQVRSARAFVSAAKKLYCSTALDGFGTHVTSTHALEQLGVEYVKLGAAHLENLVRDARRQRALQLLRDKLRRMGRTTIASGVNDVGTLMLLWQCGIDYAQGNCIQEPGEIMGYDFDQSFEYVSTSV